MGDYLSFNREKLTIVLEVLSWCHEGAYLAELCKKAGVFPNTVYEYERLGFIDVRDMRYYINHEKGAQWLTNSDKEEISNFFVMTAPLMGALNNVVTSSITYSTILLNPEERLNLQSQLRQNVMNLDYPDALITTRIRHLKPEDIFISQTTSTINHT